MSGTTRLEGSSAGEPAPSGLGPSAWPAAVSWTSAVRRKSAAAWRAAVTHVGRFDRVGMSTHLQVSAVCLSRSLNVLRLTLDSAEIGRVDERRRGFDARDGVDVVLALTSGQIRIARQLVDRFSGPGLPGQTERERC